MQGFLLSNRKIIVSLQHQDNTDIIRIIWFDFGEGVVPLTFFISTIELFIYILVLSYVTLLESLLIRVLLIGRITKKAA